MFRESCFLQVYVWRVLFFFFSSICSVSLDFCKYRCVCSASVFFLKVLCLASLVFLQVHVYVSRVVYFGSIYFASLVLGKYLFGES